MVLVVDIFGSCMVLGIVSQCDGALVVAVDEILITDMIPDFSECGWDFRDAVGEIRLVSSRLG